MQVGSTGSTTVSGHFWICGLAIWDTSGLMTRSGEEEPCISILNTPGGPWSRCWDFWRFRMILLLGVGFAFICLFVLFFVCFVVAQAEADLTMFLLQASAT